MKSNRIKKINQLGKVGHVVCKIGKIVTMIISVICLIVGMFYAPTDTMKIELITESRAVIRLDENMYDTKGLALKLDGEILKWGDNTYKVMLEGTDEPITETAVFQVSNLKWALFLGVLTYIAIYIFFCFADRLCKQFRDCETPFTERISKELMNLAWSLILINIINIVTDPIIDLLLVGKCDMDISVDLTMTLLVLGIFMLSFIFKYGTELQAESDETL